MRILFLSTLLLISFKSYGSDASAASAAAEPAGDQNLQLPKVRKLSDGVTVIDNLDRMREQPYGYSWAGTQPAQAVTWLDEDHIAAGVHTEVELYDKRTNEKETLFGKNQIIRALSSAQKVIVSGYGATVKILDTTKAQPTRKYCNVGCVSSVAISDDATLVVAGGYAYDGENSHTVALYDVRQKSRLSTLQFPNFITSVAVSPDGKKIAVGNGCQVDYGDIGTTLRVRTGSADTNKKHSLVQAVTFTQSGGLYSGDNSGLLICPMDEETGYDSTLSDDSRPWISGLAHSAGGVWVLANTPYQSRTNQAPRVTRRAKKAGEQNNSNTFYDLSGKHLGACAANKAGDLAVVGSNVLMIENKE